MIKRLSAYKHLHRDRWRILTRLLLWAATGIMLVQGSRLLLDLRDMIGVVESAWLVRGQACTKEGLSSGVPDAEKIASYWSSAPLEPKEIARREAFEVRIGGIPDWDPRETPLESVIAAIDECSRNGGLPLAMGGVKIRLRGFFHRGDTAELRASVSYWQDHAGADGATTRRIVALPWTFRLRREAGSWMLTGDERTGPRQAP